VDGEEKDKISDEMRMIGEEPGNRLFLRDAANVEASHLVVFIGVCAKPRALDCGLCGVESCAAAAKGGISCAMAVNDLGIAVGSAAATAMDLRMDNRIMYRAGVAALRLGFFPKEVGICFGIPLAITGKNIFFDRKF